jgi:hypothetical protein
MPPLWLLVDVQNVYDSIREGFGSEARVDMLTVRQDAIGGQQSASGRAVPSTAAHHMDEHVDDGRPLDDGMRWTRSTGTSVGGRRGYAGTVAPTAGVHGRPGAPEAPGHAGRRHDAGGAVRKPGAHGAARGRCCSTSFRTTAARGRGTANARSYCTRTRCWRAVTESSCAGPRKTQTPERGRGSASSRMDVGCAGCSGG